MSTASDRKLVLVVRKTRLQELIERFNSWPQAKFYLEHNHVDVQDYLDEHDLYTSQITTAEHTLRPLGLFQRLDREFLPSYQFGRRDIVVVIGQDGLVANTLKYLTGQPVIGVNPDPLRWDGKLLPFEVPDLSATVTRAIQNDVDRNAVTFAEANTNLGQRMLAVNDLFIGPKSHTSARYKISWADSSEVQSSSGIIVSTGLGSTGWYKSILAGANGIVKPSKISTGGDFPWNSKRLQFAVREPFPSQTTGTNIVSGEVRESNELVLESFMPENGVIFSDGVEADSIPFNSGCIASIRISNVQGNLVAQ